eukprot:3280790-Ditylum_brightwellii.AAC.1
MGGNTKRTNILHFYSSPRHGAHMLNGIWRFYNFIWRRHMSNIFIPPLQGLSQGNGAAPCIWALVSTPILIHYGSKGMEQPLNI